MSSLKNSLDKFLFFFSVFCCVMSYFCFDPIKSSFFLIFSMIFCMPMVSFFGYVWFSYFVCMLFLSGVFVILVYFSSMSSLILFKPYFFFVGLFLTLIFFSLDFLSLSLSGFKSVGLQVFYYEVNVFLLIYLVLVLLVFMNFVSYMLSFSGALRSV